MRQAKDRALWYSFKGRPIPRSSSGLIIAGDDVYDIALILVVRLDFFIPNLHTVCVYVCDRQFESINLSV